MTKCDYAGCGNEAQHEVPTMERPSPIPTSHPDYKPPKTLMQVCSVHVAHAIARAAALEVELLHGPFDNPADSS